MRIRANSAVAAMLVVLSMPACGQTVTLAELDGALVRASASFQNRVLWNGKEIWNNSRTDWTITIGSRGAGHAEWSTTVQDARGSRTSAPRSGSFTVGQPRETASLRGGHVLWAFDSGVLTMLQTYRIGGFKISIAFARTAGALTCTIRAFNAREVGAGNIRRKSAFGGDFELIGATATGSTCRVDKG